MPQAPLEHFTAFKERLMSGLVTTISLTGDFNQDLGILREHSIFRDKLVRIYGNFSHGLVQSDISKLVSFLGGIVQNPASKVRPDILLYSGLTARKPSGHLSSPKIKPVKISDLSQWVSVPLDLSRVNHYHWMLLVKQVVYSSTTESINPQERKSEVMTEERAEYKINPEQNASEQPDHIRKRNEEIVARLRTMADAIENGSMEVTSYKNETDIVSPANPFAQGPHVIAGGQQFGGGFGYTHPSLSTNQQYTPPEMGFPPVGSLVTRFTLGVLHKE